MLANSFRGKSSRQQDDISFFLYQALGMEPQAHARLNTALYAGLQPVVNGLREGDLTEEQASLLIEFLLAGYIEASINGQLDALLQSWADTLLAGD